jgi:transcriptional regulator with XRE-family HTH domain
MRRIGENIRFYRNLRSLTQTALARKVQVAPAYISQIEANQRVPSLKVTRRIANVLGIEMSVLVREADPRAHEGRLSDSEKLDLLRTLIMAIEGESRSPGDETTVRTVEGREFVATELYSEPEYSVVLREPGPVLRTGSIRRRVPLALRQRLGPSERRPRGEGPVRVRSAGGPPGPCRCVGGRHRGCDRPRPLSRRSRGAARPIDPAMGASVSSPFLHPEASSP